MEGRIQKYEWIKTYLELHRAKLVEEIAHGLSDGAPSDLVLCLCCCLDRVFGQVIERDHISQHSDCFIERTESVVRRVTVLLQIIFFDELGHLQCDLVCLGQRSFAYQLYNFGQVFFLLQNLLALYHKWEDKWTLMKTRLWKAWHTLVL